MTVAFAVMLFFGDILAPVLVAVILAYLMQGVANVLRQRGLPGELSVAFSTLLFLGGFFAVLFGLAPLVWRQLVALVRDGNDAQKESAAAALRNLAWTHANLYPIAEAGGVPPLLALVRDVLLQRAHLR